MRPTAFHILVFAQTLEGTQLITHARARPFSLKVIPTGIEFVPESTGEPRRVSTEMVQLVYDEYTRSQSLRPSHYQAITFDASYLLALIDLYVRRDGAGPP